MAMVFERHPCHKAMTLASPPHRVYIAANISDSLSEWAPTGPALFYFLQD